VVPGAVTALAAALDVDPVDRERSEAPDDVPLHLDCAGDPQALRHMLNHHFAPVVVQLFGG
jgi:hypothetical protein